MLAKNNDMSQSLLSGETISPEKMQDMLGDEVSCKPTLIGYSSYKKKVLRVIELHHKMSLALEQADALTRV